MHLLFSIFKTTKILFTLEFNQNFSILTLEYDQKQNHFTLENSHV